MTTQELIKNYDEAVKRVHALTGDESEEVMNAVFDAEINLQDAIINKIVEIAGIERFVAMKMFFQQKEIVCDLLVKYETATA